MTKEGWNYGSGIMLTNEDLNAARKNAGFWPVIDAVFTLIYLALLTFFAKSSTLWYSLFHILHVWIWSFGIPMAYTAFRDPTFWFIAVIAASLLFDIIALIIRIIMQIVQGVDTELFFLIVNIGFIILDCLVMAFVVNLSNTISEYEQGRFRSLTTPLPSTKK